MNLMILIEEVCLLQIQLSYHLIRLVIPIVLPGLGQVPIMSGWGCRQFPRGLPF